MLTSVKMFQRPRGEMLGKVLIAATAFPCPPLFKFFQGGQATAKDCLFLDVSQDHCHQAISADLHRKSGRTGDSLDSGKLNDPLLLPNPFKPYRQR